MTVPQTPTQIVRVTIEENIATITFDLPGKPVNAIGSAFLRELNVALDQVEREKPAGVIFASGKSGNFIAGADLFEIKNLDSAGIENFLAEGQNTFGRIADLPMPTAAALNGDALGGGLELALACTYRVAADEPSINLGLPEVKLGILPGWGGTSRLPRLIGLTNALPLILAGKMLSPRKAQKEGIVDELVRPEVLLTACRRLLSDEAARHAPSWKDRLAVAAPFVRHRILAAAREKTLAETHGHYPAPLKILDVIETGYEHGFEAGLAAERKGLAELAGGDVAKNLLRLFFLRTGAKKVLAQQVPVKAAAVKRVAVIGGGTMGAGIAHSLISGGVEVRLIEVNTDAVAAALGRVQGMIDKDVAGGRMTELGGRDAMHRLSPTADWTGLELVDCVIEAVLETIPAKKEVFARLDQHTRPDTVLATNTSSLSVAEIATAVAKPGRVVGLHFFNPVSRMPLVEIVKGPQSHNPSLATAGAVAARMGKVPVLVNDSPGFLVNRILIPYLSEAFAMASEGIPLPTIDQAALHWGMPMGPFELTDEIGLDVAAHVLRSLTSVGQAQVPAALQKAVENGWLGRKTKRGFYLHDKEKRGDGDLELNADMTALLHPGPTPTTLPSQQDIEWRLVLPMVNEAAKLLREGVVDSTDAIDLATVMGLGLAPFRGGLARFMDTTGSTQLVQQLQTLAAQHGTRFDPSPLLLELAAANLLFSKFATLTGATTTGATTPTPMQT